MSEAALLRVLADRIEELDSLKLFPADITDPGTVSVEWSAFNEHPGYDALSAAISAMVEQHWNALRSQVVKKKESEVQGARKAWSEFGTTTTVEAPAAMIEGLPTSVSAAPAPAMPSRVQLVQRQA